MKSAINAFEHKKLSDRFPDELALAYYQMSKIAASDNEILTCCRKGLSTFEKTFGKDAPQYQEMKTKIAELEANGAVAKGAIAKGAIDEEEEKAPMAHPLTALRGVTEKQGLFARDTTPPGKMRVQQAKVSGQVSAQGNNPALTKTPAFGKVPAPTKKPSCATNTVSANKHPL